MLAIAKPENQLTKGSGYHYDLLLMGLLVGLCSILGFPWVCAAAVRSIQHFNTLSVFSKTYPGVKPQLIKVYEQRITSFVIHVLISKYQLFVHLNITLYSSPHANYDIPYQVNTHPSIVWTVCISLLCLLEWNTTCNTNAITFCTSKISP